MRIALTLATFLLISCGNSNESEKKDPVLTEKVSTIELLDVADFGNGKDLQVKFNKVENESKVDHYRIYLLKSSVGLNQRYI